MKSVSPKNFYHLIIVYVIFLLPLGFWFAKPIVVFVSLFLLLPAIWSNKFYLKPPINPNLINFFWAIPFIFGFLFILNGMDIRDNYVNAKNQLEKITGIIPEKSTYLRVSRYYSTNYLEINGKAFHCENYSNDGCYRVCQYRGQMATVWYQPNTANGNLAHEIEVNGQRIYEFERQKSLFLEQKSIAIHQWFWTFILLVLPTIWLGRIDRKIRKSLPTMTQEQAKEFQKQLNENTESMGCLGLIGMMFFLIISIISGTFAMIMYIAKDIPSTILLGVTTLVTAYFTYFCAKPTKKKSSLK